MEGRVTPAVVARGVVQWVLQKYDPGLALFTACVHAGAPTLPFRAGMRVLEVGCCEADWLHLAADKYPNVTFIGIDTRAPNVVERDGRVERRCADVMQADLFAPESFDAVVSISAIEHIGLGHYKDPVDPDGDSKAMANIWRWLKPGGWVYFDVPYDPSGYRVQGTKCRVYDDSALTDRLQCAIERPDKVPIWFGYSTANLAGTLIPKPTAPVKPFHYCAMVWQKASTSLPG